MLNSFSSSHSSATSSSQTTISNVGNTINLSPIVRTCTEAKFKKVNINSQEFDLLLSDNPRIVNEKIEHKHDFTSHYDVYEFTTQEVQVLSFNPIKEDTMLIEYLIVGDKCADIINIWRSDTYSTYDKAVVLEKIYNKVLTNN